MNETKKDYYKVTELSERFEVWQNANADGLRQERYVTQALMWQARFQCAIAQQLTIIAGHLGRIVGKAEDLNNGSH